MQVMSDAEVFSAAEKFLVRTAKRSKADLAVLTAAVHGVVDVEFGKDALTGTTICVAKRPGFKGRWYGTSKRNKTDADRPEVGETLALQRALTNYLKAKDLV